MKMLGVRGKGPVYKLNRSQKATMIEAVLATRLGSPVSGHCILDIGCGNGDIGQHFSEHNRTCGVDISDKRRAENQGFEFHRVQTEHLPFPDAFFDVVLSHHVIEHVGDQLLHLSEIRRVLKSGGILYLATPNKSSPIMQGHVGNTQVLRHARMRPLFEGAGFEVEEMSVALVKQPDRFHAEIRSLSFIPISVLKVLRPLFPSHVFLLAPRRAQNVSP